MNDTKCLYCGCTDYDACISDKGEACHWIVVYHPLPFGEGRGEGTGICSNCAEIFNLRISISIENVEHITQIINLRDR
ncbi:MAG: hypothetical protein M1469_01135 [Bacteroidetes bacterium]|nr:hypothetical protein [Bacteroidota bacterium]